MRNPLAIVKKLRNDEYFLYVSQDRNRRLYERKNTENSNFNYTLFPEKKEKIFPEIENQNGKLLHEERAINKNKNRKKYSNKNNFLLFLLIFSVCIIHLYNLSMFLRSLFEHRIFISNFSRYITNVIPFEAISWIHVICTNLDQIVHSPSLFLILFDGSFLFFLTKREKTDYHEIFEEFSKNEK